MAQYEQNLFKKKGIKYVEKIINSAAYRYQHWHFDRVSTTLPKRQPNLVIRRWPCPERGVADLLPVHA
jgi:hypothetical protein